MGMYTELLLKCEINTKPYIDKAKTDAVLDYLFGDGEEPEDDIYEINNPYRELIEMVRHSSMCDKDKYYMITILLSFPDEAIRNTFDKFYKDD